MCWILGFLGFFLGVVGVGLCFARLAVFGLFLSFFGCSSGFALHGLVAGTVGLAEGANGGGGFLFGFGGFGGDGGLGGGGGGGELFGLGGGCGGGG